MFICKKITEDCCDFAKCSDVSQDCDFCKELVEVEEIVRCRKCAEAQLIDDVLYCPNWGKNVDRDDWCCYGWA